jgi:hypothetical protein
VHNPLPYFYPNQSGAFLHRQNNHPIFQTTICPLLFLHPIIKQKNAAELSIPAIKKQEKDLNNNFRQDNRHRSDGH